MPRDLPIRRLAFHRVDQCFVPPISVALQTGFQCCRNPRTSHLGNTYQRPGTPSGTLKRPDRQTAHPLPSRTSPTPRLAVCELGRPFNKSSSTTSAATAISQLAPGSAARGLAGCDRAASAAGGTHLVRPCGYLTMPCARAPATSTPCPETAAQ